QYRRRSSQNEPLEKARLLQVPGSRSLPGHTCGGGGVVWAASLRVVGIASFGVGTSRVRETARVTWGSGA
ncbi:hypothetical protein, partial [Frondihabitans sp. VKM Ac-2883]|uniref:hypothetical protein n=1 Tax=Frondihabitans sp. VKM Ac-2883 TaxID=2783823 RepID=UPI001E386367